ncbi:hypothetical protein FIBSPDRAFT_858507 [Athelia psychrophila]|uniref:Uncharacterized protein n=1 Tax=Athelia psychrophila TaxID=1759441 RepID=A0A166LRP5_9AGAM|nr:hypothetical protein FIBSPDRAFT_858507 [Fibularhizoctonia sp. CBS 109695]
MFQRTRAAPLSAKEHEECAKLQWQMERRSHIADVKEEHSQGPVMARYFLEKLMSDREMFQQELRQIDYTRCHKK